MSEARHSIECEAQFGDLPGGYSLRLQRGGIQIGTQVLVMSHLTESAANNSVQ